MSEQEWLACTNPTLLLEFLRNKVSERKLRLFACACCRLSWHLLIDGRNRNAVEVAERFSDWRVSDADLEAANSAANQTIGEREWLFPEGGTDYDKRMTEWVAAHDVACATAPLGRMWHILNEHSSIGRNGGWVKPPVIEQMQEARSALLLDIVGSLPFRDILVDPILLRWNDATVVKLAQAFYEDRAFALLPILADALEDAGCDNDNILTHLRSDGPHVRGCWPVDLILGKC